MCCASPIVTNSQPTLPFLLFCKIVKEREHDKCSSKYLVSPDFSQKLTQITWNGNIGNIAYLFLYTECTVIIKSKSRANMLLSLLCSWLMWTIGVLCAAVVGWVGWWMILRPTPPPTHITQPYAQLSIFYPLKVAVFYCLVKFRKVSYLPIRFHNTYKVDV